MKITKEMTINAPVDKVWKVWAHDFDNAHQWMASVPNSYAAAHGQRFDGARSAGRTCELTDKPNGLQAVEQFLNYDEGKRVATVRVDFANTPAGFPVRYNEVTVSMEDAGEGKTHMTWRFRSHIKPLAILMWPALRQGFNVFVGQIMEELQHFVENDQVHPRKQKALAKLAKKAAAATA